jgi:hypothetical protein
MNLQPDTARIRVEAARVAMAIPFRATSDIRYYLNGIAIQPEVSGGANVLASDGHTAICVHDVGGRADRATILPLNKQQLPFLKKGGHVLVNDEGRAWITDADGVVLWISPTTEIEGKFPDIRSVVGPFDSYAPGLVGSFNPQLIDRIRKVYSGRAKYKGVRFFHRESSEGTAALCALGRDGFVLVMPMRDEDPVHALEHALPPSFRKVA